MSEHDLTPKQQILLWDLVSRGGTAMQKEMKPDVEKADRELLMKRKHISVGKENRAYRLTLEEQGWNYLASREPTLLTAGQGSKYDRPILQFVLVQVQRFAITNKFALAQLLAARCVEADRPEGASASDARLAPALVERQIRDAFFAIAGRPPVTHVRFRALRERLSDVPRDQLDLVLVQMKEAQTARFSTLNNPQDIEREGNAPLTIKGREFHTMWIDP